MNFILESNQFFILILSAIILAVISSMLILINKKCSLIEKALLLIVAWTLPFLGSITCLIFLAQKVNFYKSNTI